MLPANLTNKIRSYRYNSSVKEEGFRADTLTIEYASIDEATYIATAEAINNATAAGDALPFVVNVDGFDVELFRGVVNKWRLGESSDPNVHETVGILEAQDERGRLLTTPASDTQQFRGPALGFATLTYNQRFSEAFAELTRQSGLIVQGALPRDYFFHTQLMSAGMSTGGAIAGLLAPLQEFRGLRNDLVRDGQTYTVRARTIPLGAPDITIPGWLAHLKSYELHFPKDPVLERTALTPGQVFQPDGLGTTGILPSVDTNITRTYDTPDGGTVTLEFFLGRIMRKRIVKRPIAGDGTQFIVIDDIVFRYGGFLRRIEGWTNTISINNVVERRDVVTIIYSPDDKDAVEHTQRYVRATTGPSSGSLVLEQPAVITKAETDAGAVKVLSEDRISGNTVVVEPRFYEFSQGDLDATPEFPLPAREGIIRPEDRIDPTPQRGRALLEVSLDIPFDPRMSAGRILGVDPPNIVTAATIFYIVGVNASWRKGSGHQMSVDGETWI